MTVKISDYCTLPQAVSLEGAAGKTVASCTEAHDSYVAIKFTDGSVLILEADVFDDDARMVVHQHVGECLLYADGLDLVPKDQFQRWSAARDAEYQASQKEWRRREYERLKAEFEGK